MSREIEPPSLRSFGLTFTVVCLALSLLPWILHGVRPSLLLLSIAVGFFVVTFLVPRVLKPFNFVWFRFSLFLHGVVNPVLMALSYYGAFLPTGLVLRLMGSDLLRLKWEPGAKTYWINREDGGPLLGSMNRQF